ncbi:hemerythrin domain-containing protein [Methylomagnum ishizawai]|uniref:hemerythrin domain-containing protein n=1 Tax=Methylomagnum ishizawai TaxID=1760988 RepID=UPI001C3241C9|nr:hemerythrin domain-containing protein [Methylomagnum ishizawai]BBL75673.1 hemerythrin [Methylomagnum ishizawai]
MHRLLNELHQDHVNLGRVLRILENQLGLLRAGADADIHVLGEIIDYVQSYPDLVHHPREDVIFAAYRARALPGIDVIERLMAEHRTLLDSTAQLKVSLEQWHCDSPIPREQVAGQIDDYLRLQWEHLNLEEGSIYGMLAEGLGDEDWAGIEAGLPRGSDPLFTDQMRRRYQNIYERVVESAY